MTILARLDGGCESVVVLLNRQSNIITSPFWHAVWGKIDWIGHLKTQDMIHVPLSHVASILFL
jgi:hypothetical protein